MSERSAIRARTWTDPVATRIARIAAARWVVVPFAPVDFTVAAATTAAARIDRAHKPMAALAKTNMLETAGATLRATRFTTSAASTTAAARRLRTTAGRLAALAATACLMAALWTCAGAPGYASIALTSILLTGKLTAIHTASAAASARRLTTAASLAGAARFASAGTFATWLTTAAARLLRAAE